MFLLKKVNQDLSRHISIFTQYENAVFYAYAVTDGSIEYYTFCIEYLSYWCETIDKQIVVYHVTWQFSIHDCVEDCIFVIHCV